MRASACLVVILCAAACGGKGGGRTTTPTGGGAAVGNEGTATTADVAPPPSEQEKGLTQETAIEVCMPKGERDHIEAQKCTDGSKPTYSRVGSVGAGVDGHIIDLYEISCPDKKWEWFMDMYHCDDAEQ